MQYIVCRNIYIYIYIYTCVVYRIHVYVYMYIYGQRHPHDYTCIYIYTRNAWALPRRCSVEGPHSQSDVVATLHSIGKINKSIREY